MCCINYFIKIKNPKTYFIFLILIILFLIENKKTTAQNLPFPQPTDSLHTGRLQLVAGGALGLTAATYTALGAAWYASGLGGPFRYFDDSRQWLQLDKLGHSYGAYHVSRTLMSGLRWAGTSERTQVLCGGLSGFLFQLPIEIFDGFSPDYGASWADLAFNAAGSGLAVGNQLLWRGQRVLLRFSARPTTWAAQAPDLLGRTLPERLLKDYNGQTYWLTAAPGHWLGRWKWLSAAVGLGGAGMLGGYGTEPWADLRAREHRRYFLSVDIDWMAIPTRRRGLRLLFFALQAIKLPAPALEWNARTGWQAHAVYF